MGGSSGGPVGPLYPLSAHQSAEVIGWVIDGHFVAGSP